jgi:hypothetical protein
MAEANARGCASFRRAILPSNRMKTATESQISIEGALARNAANAPSIACLFAVPAMSRRGICNHVTRHETLPEISHGQDT